MTEKCIPTTEAQMKIRRPVEDVFEAIVNPDITTKFWFTKSSGKLASNSVVTWQWEMYNASAEVYVRLVEKNSRIVFEWSEPSLSVEFTFLPLNDQSTYVVVKEWGYHETGPELIEAIKNSTGGFTTLLDGMKAYLEHGIQLHLVEDKFSKE